MHQLYTNILLYLLFILRAGTPHGHSMGTAWAQVDGWIGFEHTHTWQIQTTAQHYTQGIFTDGIHFLKFSIC